jgi:poly-gamma-glutamate capsule biosynthesis protein CapA/YwtB (metallophosphatase superfamily)
MSNCNGGAEGSNHEHLTREYEEFLGQNRGNVYLFAHSAIDAGADIVFGHGPHVTRAVEVYKNRFIAYSMGNFCTYRRFNIQGVSGIAPIIKVFINGSGEFIKGEITATYQDKFTGTKLDPNKRVIKRMQELVREDIPESVIEIKENGEIIYK